MCYFLSKICFEIRPLPINKLLIVQPLTPRLGKAHQENSCIRVKGFSSHSRFMRWKPTWVWIHSLPPRRCAASIWVERVLIYSTARDSGFHLNPLRRHGEGRRGGFFVLGDERSSGNNPSHCGQARSAVRITRRSWPRAAPLAA